MLFDDEKVQFVLEMKAILIAEFIIMIYQNGSSWRNGVMTSTPTALCSNTMCDSYWVYISADSCLACSRTALA